MVDIDYCNVVAVTLSALSYGFVNHDKGIYLPFVGVLTSQYLTSLLNIISNSLQAMGFIKFEAKSNKRVNRAVYKSIKIASQKSKIDKRWLSQFCHLLTNYIAEGKTPEQAFYDSIEAVEQGKDSKVLTDNLKSFLHAFLMEISKDHEITAFIQYSKFEEIKKYILAVVDSDYNFIHFVSDVLVSQSKIRENISDKELFGLRYDSESTEFEGRKEELEKLRAFLDDKARLSWWVVTGVAGIGKSRLLYQFTKDDKQQEPWTKIWLPSFFFHDNMHLKYEPWKLSLNLLMIIDGAEEAEKIGNFLRRLWITENNRTLKIRVL